MPVRLGNDYFENEFFSFIRIYSAYIKAVDGEVQKSAWGDIARTGELLQEFSSGLLIYCFS
jgi:hypothetical protein